MARDPRRAGNLASAGAACMAAVAAACGASRPPTAAMIFDVARTDVPAPAVGRLSGPLTRADLERIASIAGDELRIAFAPFRIDVGDSSAAFWRVRVVHDVIPQSHALAGTGESVALGPFGGGGFVDFEAVAGAAVRYAPVAASRREIVDAIGRGIGRVAAHELGHQILGPRSAHNTLDGHAYENGSPDRAAQYYGHLQWTTWRPSLEARLGAR